ncbi:Uncharacterized protein DBV15_12984 [Temnothorax longispinosus]|uniref:Uncharacterized protein n=1 Tax=Temnothorax longispinosus TaxID=300112 RepID=A0A4S2KJL5_9HYME|nr:Uncharacterized protein DBV15_12984 [Temnothorax longispinosus]
MRQYELRERCRLTNANRSEIVLEFDTDDEIDEDRNNYSESDTYRGDRESDENAENINATILQGSPTQIIDDNNAISDEENTEDSRSNCSTDASSEQNDDREEIVINENLENLYDSFSNSDSEYNVYIDNVNPNNIPVIGTQCDRDVYILRTLKAWALRGVSRKKINDLLSRLQPLFPILPKSYKTLLKTPRKVLLKVIGTGKMWYKGIQANIRQKLSDAYIMDKGEIVMDVNIDGLNLYNSTDGEFWPILGSFSDEADPFIIGVYYGIKKPEDINMFLEDFVAEIEELNENGFELGKIFLPFPNTKLHLGRSSQSFH